ncbi:OLC1v1018398C1 [Oldenlandia corymbosa var. corymbosa]|uniref:OLC1v1018398C1 n=1 Tax=Oldenlandia corymbosa var. corymbosa TaxID=529605 RepID=A0AAV1EBH8_OLDCO|nr:OLC1v1018398C1 [Oldenlandia corymbosa var. corymbosa]
MSTSLTVRPPPPNLFLQSRPNNQRLISFLNYPRKACKGRLVSVRAQSKNNNNKDEDGSTNAGDTLPANGAFQKTRKEILLEYVQNVQPEFMEMFVKRAPKQVVDAMRLTVTNMIGTLPPQFFAVTVTTVAENLAQLMYSVLMTGYMFRNAQYRVELQQSLEQVALPEPQNKDVPDFAPGTQKKVTGEVIRWNNVSGAEKLDAVKYIELLEAEIEELNRQIEKKSTEESNDILEYLKTLEPENLQELTSTAGEDVILAMNTFIKRLLAVSPSQMKVIFL